jgi:DNA mismatch repair protein MutL
MADPAERDIHALDPQTVERIAAGEVVERPASVVKELVENAIDAAASRVDVTVEAGGTERIAVADDGVGMTEAQVRRAVEQHTTSKIEHVADLESGVSTLGFRGEALHAIGAVARVTITTRPQAGDRGTALTLEGGEVTDVSPAGCPPGTTVEVTDLFYNVPARRKYLKQEATEFAHVNTVVTNYALANPDVAVSLAHGNRQTFATTGQGDLRETVLSVYGREVARAMIELDPADCPEGPLDGVSGLVSHPETTRAGREYCSTLVNGRYVTASTVREAVIAGYDTHLPPDRYPFAVVFLDVDPGTVDVNVHPRKLEVRFADDAAVREQVRTTVQAALRREGLVRSSAPRGRSQPDETAVDPAGATVDGPDADTSTGDAPDADAPDSADASETSDSRPVANEGAATRESSAGGAGSQPTGSTPDDAPPRPPSASDADSSTGVDDPTETNAFEGSDASERIRGPQTQARLDDAAPTATGDGDAAHHDFDRLPAMRILGQVDETYVVAETSEGLLLVDQHAADERINYERLRARFADGVTTQALAQPVEVEVTPREADLFASRGAALERIGFHAERRDENTVAVTAVPSLVAEAADPALIRDVLGSMARGGDGAETVDAAADELLADLACYPSITGNTSLTEGSVVDLLAALDDCEDPWACPHGRPTVIALDRDEIETRFERDYPGHGGRRT